jgi:hypothetical protein
MRHHHACRAALACGADDAACAPRADQNLVAEVCRRVACTLATIEALDERDGWLRDEVVDALAVCDGDVGNRVACVDAWLTMIGISR